MKIQGAIIKEQNVKFAIVKVDRSILTSPKEQNKIKTEFANLFGTIPVIFMALDSKSVATYVGRQDIVNYLSYIKSSQIPWREFSST